MLLFVHFVISGESSPKSQEIEDIMKNDAINKNHNAIKDSSVEKEYKKHPSLKFVTHNVHSNTGLHEKLIRKPKGCGFYQKKAKQNMSALLKNFKSNSHNVDNVQIDQRRDRKNLCTDVIGGKNRNPKKKGGFKKFFDFLIGKSWKHKYENESNSSNKTETSDIFSSDLTISFRDSGSYTPSEYIRLIDVDCLSCDMTYQNKNDYCRVFVNEDSKKPLDDDRAFYLQGEANSSRNILKDGIYRRLSRRDPVLLGKATSLDSITCNKSSSKNTGSVDSIRAVHSISDNTENRGSNRSKSLLIIDTGTCGLNRHNTGTLDSGDNTGTLDSERSLENWISNSDNYVIPDNTGNEVSIRGNLLKTVEIENRDPKKHQDLTNDLPNRMKKIKFPYTLPNNNSVDNELQKKKAVMNRNSLPLLIYESRWENIPLIKRTHSYDELKEMTDQLDRVLEKLNSLIDLKDEFDLTAKFKLFKDEGVLAGQYCEDIDVMEAGEYEKEYDENDKEQIPKENKKWDILSLGNNHGGNRVLLYEQDPLYDTKATLLRAETFENLPKMGEFQLPNYIEDNEGDNEDNEGYNEDNEGDEDDYDDVNEEENEDEIIFFIDQDGSLDTRADNSDMMGAPNTLNEKSNRMHTKGLLKQTRLGVIKCLEKISEVENSSDESFESNTSVITVIENKRMDDELNLDIDGESDFQPDNRKEPFPDLTKVDDNGPVPKENLE